MKTKRISPIFLLTGLISILICNNIKAQDLSNATLLTRSEQYDKASEMFQQLIQKEPANSKNYFFYGENYLAEYFADTISNSLATFTKLAKDLYNKGVSANANDPLNYIGLAKVAFFLGDDKTAAEMRAKAKSFLLPYKNIKKMVPPAKDYAFALAKIAESYIRNEKIDTAQALPYMREAIKIDSKSRDIYLITGDIYNLINDGTRAIKNYNLAQDYDPKSPTANMKIGSIYVRGRSYDAAIPYYDQAIALNAGYAPAYRELGQLYLTIGKYDLSKVNFEKYLELTKGNLPAQIRYVNTLFYAKAYDDVIKKVEEIFRVDRSKTYMNRIAGYSAYEKTPPDYNMALAYMETLFGSLQPENLLKKDYTYMAKILLKKNQDYPKLTAEVAKLKTQLTSEKGKYDGATSAVKVKLKPNIDTLSAKVVKLETQIAKSEVEINRAFGEYEKALAFNTTDKVLLSEIATNYYNYKNYEGAAKTWGKLVALGKDDISDYMQIGRAYYTGGKYKSADSVFNIVVGKSPDYLDAYVFIARTYSLMDPDAKTGLARPKFEKMIEKARIDSVKNAAQITEAYTYLGYYYSQNENFSKARDCYSRMIALDPKNNSNKIRGYTGMAQLDYKLLSNEKTIEGKLTAIAKAQDSYNKILAIDANNENARSMIANLQDYEKKVRAGINPDEIQGTIKNVAGQPIAGASIRIKDTAAETFTNAQGKYKFEIPQASEALIIKANGYKQQEIAVTKLRKYDVTLEQ
jgi:tetratricopeptide (TPR) repeat protein